MSSPDPLAATVDEIYEAMLEPTRWPQALSSVASAVRSRLPSLFHHDSCNRSGSISLTVDMDPAMQRAYQEYYAERNCWLRNDAVLKSRTVRTSHMMCSRRELLDSEWYHDFLVPLGVSQAIGATLLGQESTSSGFVAFRGPESADFDEEDLAILGQLVPHLRRALQVRRHLAESTAREQGLAQVLETLSVGALLTDQHARVLYANSSARGLLTKQYGLLIDASGLRALRLEDTARLRALIGGASLTSQREGLQSGGVMRVRGADGRTAVELLVSPLPPGQCGEGPGCASAVVYLTDPTAQAPEDATALRALYGLTACEAKMALVFKRGVSGKEAAEELDVSYNTLKTHLRHLFAKTDTRSQSELIRLINRSITNFARPPRHS
jgi:DNA-binding CsgD family transcriptional regulator